MLLLYMLLLFISAAQAQDTTSRFAYILSVDVGWPDATWPEAEQLCASHGWYLASILSSRDQDMMRYGLPHGRVLSDFAIRNGKISSILPHDALRRTPRALPPRRLQL